MRVAVLEPYPRICGVTKWAFELAPGFRALGHHCDVLSFTKSGRPIATKARGTGGPRKGWRWWSVAPDVVKPWNIAPDTLNSYDLIVLCEPKNNPLDEEAKKAGTDMWPDYVWALHETRTPWTTALHDATAYRQPHAPFLADCLSAKSFSGTAIQCRDGAFNCASWGAAGYVRKLLNWPWLPYTPKNTEHTLPKTLAIGMGGRILSTKGYSALMSVAHELPPEVPIKLFGAESGGMGPCPSFMLFETLVMHHAWTGTRGDPTFESEHRSDHSIEIGNYGATNMVHPWRLTHPNGNVIEYVGPFGNTDAISVWQQCLISAQLSTRALASSMEYTTLEAIDAGCSLVLPRYYSRDMLGAQYDVNWLDEFTEGITQRGGQGIKWVRDIERQEIIQVIRHTIERLGSRDPGVNWQALHQYHRPELLAKHILENI